jgi:hypothetical protein
VRFSDVPGVTRRVALGPRGAYGLTRPTPLVA